MCNIFCNNIIPNWARTLIDCQVLDIAESHVTDKGVMALCGVILTENTTNDAQVRQLCLLKSLQVVVWNKIKIGREPVLRSRDYLFSAPATAIYCHFKLFYNHTTNRGRN